MTAKMHKGFTLIELMIVVAIIGILAAIAIPAYQNYTIRAQITEGLTLADGWKTAIGEYFANTGNWPGSTSALAGGTLSASVGKYSTVSVGTGGVIQITHNGNSVNSFVSGSTLGLTPYTDTNGDVIWVCGLATVASGASKATGASASNSISARYLPQSWHS